MKISFKRLLVFLLFFFFGILLFQNPFSGKNEISSFSPLPDAGLYVNEARSIAQGVGFGVYREGRLIPYWIPSFYPLTLVPSYLFNLDPRAFYFTNVALAILGAFLFFKILNHITKNFWIKVLVFTLFITNFYIYRFPQMAMAENLLIVVYLAAILLLLNPINKSNLIIAGLIPILFVGTKYVSIVLAFIFFLSYICKIFFNKKSSLSKLRLFGVFLLVTMVFGLIFLLTEYLSKGDYLFLNILWRLDLYEIKDVGSGTPLGFFNIEYFRDNFIRYFATIMGGQTQVLESIIPMISPFIAMPSLFAIILGVIWKKYRFLSISLALMLFGMTVFMSFFFSFDARYIYISIPTLLIFFTILLSLIEKYLRIKGVYLIFPLVLSGILALQLYSFGDLIKRRIYENFYGEELSWTYAFVAQVNEKLKDKSVNKKKPILVTALSPLVIDLYSNNSYLVLPISRSGHFINYEKQVWGNVNLSDLPALYKKKLEEGHLVYVSNFHIDYLANAAAFRDFGKIEKEFKLTKIFEGCSNYCNLYQLSVAKLGY